MSIFRVYVDGQIFYHPHLSKLAITEATYCHIPMHQAGTVQTLY